MSKLILRVLADFLIGMLAAGIVLAIGVPLLMRAGVIAKGDLAGSLLITAILIGVTGGIVLRPGSALNPRNK